MQILQSVIKMLTQFYKCNIVHAHYVEEILSRQKDRIIPIFYIEVTAG
jgi:hypothetical protein